MHKQDTWIGIIAGSLGGATKFFLTIENDFWIKFFGAGITALFCGLMGVIGKEIWYFIKKNAKQKAMDFKTTLLERLKAETPIWFKGIISLSLALAVAGGALLTAPTVVTGFVLPNKIELFAQWCVVAGVVAGAVAKTAKTN